MQIPDIKRCEKCYKIISDINTSDYYSHIRIKYCPDCKEIVLREKTKARMQRLRERKKLQEQERNMKIKQLEAENDILRKRLEAIWDLKCQQNSAG